ncbi:hypothetical protein BCR35DRAFT_294923, partial [Leucosporidium creatinivorum]
SSSRSSAPASPARARRSHSAVFKTTSSASCTPLQISRSKSSSPAAYPPAPLAQNGFPRGPPYRRVPLWSGKEDARKLFLLPQGASSLVKAAGASSLVLLVVQPSNELQLPPPLSPCLTRFLPPSSRLKQCTLLPPLATSPSTAPATTSPLRTLRTTRPHPPLPPLARGLALAIPSSSAPRVSSRATPPTSVKSSWDTFTTKSLSLKRPLALARRIASVLGAEPPRGTPSSAERRVPTLTARTTFNTKSSWTRFVTPRRASTRPTLSVLFAPRGPNLVRRPTATVARAARPRTFALPSRPSSTTPSSTVLERTRIKPPSCTRSF